MSIAFIITEVLGGLAQNLGVTAWSSWFCYPQRDTSSCFNLHWMRMSFREFLVNYKNASPNHSVMWSITLLSRIHDHKCDYFISATQICHACMNPPTKWHFWMVGMGSLLWQDVNPPSMNFLGEWSLLGSRSGLAICNLQLWGSPWGNFLNLSEKQCPTCPTSMKKKLQPCSFEG